MKKIILSAAVAAMAFSTSAVAADKGIDIDVSGQAVLYYETHNDNGTPAANTGDGYFDQANTVANAGLQLNLGADLGNNFTFGSQLTYLGGLGLTNSVAGAAKQNAGTANTTTAQLALTKIFIAKQIANTTVKMGRQELPKSLSPLAFTEGWTVFKNTFDAILVVNTDLPKTTLVGAYVSSTTGNGVSTLDLSSNLDLGIRVNNPGAVGTATVAENAYMITAQTKLIPMTTATLSYYRLRGITGTTYGVAEGADAYWADAQVAPKDAPLGLKVGLQGGIIAPDQATAFADTKALGAKVSAKVGAISLKAIYTQVSSSDDKKVIVAVANTGTGVKSPLYSQMLYNQKAIDTDNKTIVIGAGYDAGSIGKFAVNYGMTTMGDANQQNTSATAVNTADGIDQDYNELDISYKIKSGGVQYFAVAAIRDWDNQVTINSTTTNGTGATKDTIIRFWARYNF